MSRRRRHESPFSLFAFQDVMMTVMGIMILITLLLLLEITETVGEVVSREPSDAAQQAVSEAEVAARQREVQRLRERFERASAAVDLLGTSLPEARERIEQLEMELVEIREELEARRGEVELTREELDETEDSYAEELRELRDLHEEIDEVRAGLDAYRRNPRLTYRVDRDLRQRPILVEIDGRRVGVAPHDQPDFGLWFTDADPARRFASLFAFARTRSTDSEYFVLLVKPSGFDHYETILTTLQEAGFQVGTEVIHEHISGVAPLPGAGGEGGR